MIPHLLPSSVSTTIKRPAIVPPPLRSACFGSGKKLGMGSGELMEVDLLLLDAKVVGNVARDQWKSMSYVVFLIRMFDNNERM
ncbi:BnaCnng14060D [Brassica napus]|uniref:BnaCnng14060D protein n=1 Tax=Brassica napus TaxID=3708 RepID=A0A078IB88_BRANA|nr:BnaCnng14060D [Brassica napus]